MENKIKLVIVLARKETHRKLLMGETEMHISCGEKSRGD
jgi:hypothetical protein